MYTYLYRVMFYIYLHIGIRNNKEHQAQHIYIYIYKHSHAYRVVAGDIKWPHGLETLFRCRKNSDSVLSNYSVLSYEKGACHTATMLLL